MIKTWQQRYNEACLDPVAGERSSRELISEAKLAEIDELRAANARLWLEREEPHRTIQDYLYECNSLEQERDELLAKLAALEQEANEEDALRERLSGLLTKSVNAIRGEPAELSLHSWHDLPELCNGLVEKLAESEKCLQDSIDCNLNKLLAMSDEQVTALTRLDGGNPDDVAALARKAMQCAVLTVERDELRADLDAERDAAELKSACITGMRQEITAWSATAENLEAERDALKACCVEFVRKVECGEAKSTASYNQMKQALSLKEANHD